MCWYIQRRPEQKSPVSNLQLIIVYNCFRVSQSMGLSLWILSLKFSHSIHMDSSFPLATGATFLSYVWLRFLNTSVSCLDPKHWVSVWPPILHVFSIRNALRLLERSFLNLFFSLWNPSRAILWYIPISRLCKSTNYFKYLNLGAEWLEAQYV